MIDLHSHLLPGLDDGPRTDAEALVMARRARKDGITSVVATPHIDHVHGVTAADVLRAGLALRRMLAAAQVEVNVLTGGEVTAMRASELSDSELRAVALGSSSWVLLECPLSRTAPALEEAVFALELRGFRVVLAHPERSPQLLGNVERVRELVGRGALCSITGGSLLGRFGSPPKTFCVKLLAEGLVHNVASDAHDDARRPLALAEAVAEAVRVGPFRPGFARWLTHDVPEAVLADRPVPDLPPAGRPERRRVRGRYTLPDRR